MSHLSDFIMACEGPFLIKLRLIYCPAWLLCRSKYHKGPWYTSHGTLSESITAHANSRSCMNRLKLDQFQLICGSSLLNLIATSLVQQLESQRQIHLTEYL